MISFGNISKRFWIQKQPFRMPSLPCIPFLLRNKAKALQARSAFKFIQSTKHVFVPLTEIVPAQWPAISF
jgi:hypothetical protein